MGQVFGEVQPRVRLHMDEVAEGSLCSYLLQQKSPGRLGRGGRGHMSQPVPMEASFFQPHALTPREVP